MNYLSSFLILNKKKKKKKKKKNRETERVILMVNTAVASLVAYGTVYSCILLTV